MDADLALRGELLDADLDPEAGRDLARAAALLEQPSFLIVLANHVGVPIERLAARLPGKATRVLTRAVDTALHRAADVAVGSLGRGPRRFRGERFHRIATMVTGAVGGAGGLAALAVELPVTTTVMLRSIAEIAAEEGEDLATLEARLACLEVFALGGRSRADDAADNAYFALRAALAEGVRAVVDRSAGGGMGRALGELIVRIASRFELVVGEKAVAQAAPVLGALGGAGINAVFTAHFQRMARGHFIVRRLERRWGREAVRAAYGRIVGEGLRPPGA